MALPVWALVTIYLTVAGGGGFALYQLRATVESVEEVFTDPDSSLNSIVWQAIIGGLVTWLLVRAWR